MVVFPNCKINIGLNILNKREDGFHNIETVFIPIPLTDSLEIIHAKENTADVIFSQSGFAIDGNTEDNICVKAYHLLKKDFPQLPAIQMHLHKTIPTGAGLGGGSANAAFTIQLLNKKYQLNLSEEQLINYSLYLGSDCPFFIYNKTCFATGRGEQLVPVEVSLTNYYLVLVNPHIHINTGWAFGQLKKEAETNNLSQNLLYHIQQPIQNWRNTIINDFEAPVFSAHPALKKIKETLYNNGALYAAMSGSGSTMFGLFPQKSNPAFNFPENWLVRKITF